MRKVETASLESWLYTIKEDTQHVVMFLGQSLQAKDLQSSTLTYDAFKLFPDASLIIDINTLEFRLAFCTLIPQPLSYFKSTMLEYRTTRANIGTVQLLKVCTVQTCKQFSGPCVVLLASRLFPHQSTFYSRLFSLILV